MVSFHNIMPRFLFSCSFPASLLAALGEQDRIFDQKRSHVHLLRCEEYYSQTISEGRANYILEDGLLERKTTLLA